MILRSDFNPVCHIRGWLGCSVNGTDGGGINKLINKPTSRSTDIYSSVVTSMEDVSEASITDRNYLFNKNSSMIHQSSFALIYWFISLPLFPRPYLSLTPTFLTQTHLPAAPPSPSASFLYPPHLTAKSGLTGSHSSSTAAAM